MARRITTLLIGGLFAGALAQAQQVPARAAAAILADYDGVVYPSFSEGNDPEALARFKQAIDDASHRQEALAVELVEAHPDHARVAELLRRRWELLVNVDRDCGAVRKETARYVEAGADGANETAATDPRRIKLAHVMRAWACVDDETLPAATRVADLERAVALAPDDYYARGALLDYAKRKTCDAAFQRDVATRVAALDPGRGGDGDEARRLAKILDGIGRPLAADLVDAKSQQPFTLAQLHGHPVVVSFLPGPWSDREPREAATLNALFREFSLRGVELVAVHELYSSDDLADRTRHLRDLALPGRACLEVRGDGTTLKERLLGADEGSPSLLLDGEGRLVAVCFEAAPLKGALLKLLPPPVRRRPI